MNTESLFLIAVYLLGGICMWFMLRPEEDDEKSSSFWMRLLGCLCWPVVFFANMLVTRIIVGLTTDLTKDLIRRHRGYPKEYIVRLPEEYTGAQILKALMALGNNEWVTSLLNYESGVSIEKKSSQKRTVKLRYSISLAMAHTASGEVATCGPLAFETERGSGQFEPCQPWTHLRTLTFKELPVWFFEGGEGWDQQVRGAFPQNLEKGLIANLQRV